MQNKTILITGATNGIGRELAITCLNKGSNILALGKNKKKLEELYTFAEKQNLSNSLSLVPFNLAGATPENYMELAQNIAEQYGTLDGLVHNAAIQGQKTEIIHYDILKWYETIQVNLNAPFLLTKALLPLLKLSKQSCIIFTTANEGIHGKAYQGAYGASKAAIKNFMETLSAECESYTNININAINPSKVYSRIYTQNFPATDPRLVSSTKDIMPLYLKLLYNPSNSIHGETVVFNSRN